MKSQNQPAMTHIMLRDPELRRQLEACAAKERRSMNAVVLTALEEYLQRWRPSGQRRQPSR